MVSVLRCFLSCLGLGIGCVILLWHSLGLPYSYSIKTDNFNNKLHLNGFALNIYIYTKRRCILSIFWKYKIQLDSYFNVHVSGRRQTGLETKTSTTSPGNMVHVIDELFVVSRFL